MANTQNSAAPARNAPCPCGSGRRYKRCCGLKDSSAADSFSTTPPPAIEQLLASGAEAYRAGRLNEAEPLFAQALTRQPQHFQALLMHGAILGRLRRIPLAIGRLRRAIAVQPQSADARLLLANFLRETGELGEAVSILQEAIGLSPGDPVLHSDLGLAYLRGHSIAEAIMCFERAVAIDPNFAIAHFNLACALERERRLADAVSAYRRAIALAPNLVEAHSRLGNLLHAQGRRDEAMACFRGAAAAAPNSTLGRLNWVKVLLEEEKSAEAEAALRSIVALDPRSSEAHRLLGNNLRETGRFDEATACLGKAIDLDPAQISAYHDLVHCKRLGAADRPLIARMLARLEAGDLADHERALLHFALGKGLDDLGAWEEAIGHIDQANRLERRGLLFDREALAGRCDRLMAVFTPDRIARSRGVADCEKPILIVGMPRSGTTLVEQVLSSHPEIAAGGELGFWNERAPALIDGFDGAAAPPARALADDYRALLRHISPGAARVTDKMPFNFFWIGLVRAVLPNAYIIHCRRNPVDTCLSIWFTRFAMRQDFAYQRGDIAFYYRQYARLMDYWRRALPSDRFLEVDYEDLVADRDRATRQLIAFTGLEWDDSCLQPENNRRVVKTASMWQARQPVYRTSVERWRRYEPWIGEFLPLLPSKSRAGG